MKIQIENFNGISKLDYEIVDNKVNFLFGLSGCGKSSIAKALTRTDDIENYQRVGNNISKVDVKVNGNDLIPGKYFVYDKKYMEDIVINKTNNEDVYTILIGDGEEIKKCKSDYEKAIKDLLPIKDQLLDVIKAIYDIKTKLKLESLSNKKKKSTNLIEKMQSNIDSIPTYKNGVKYSVEETNWLVEGTKMDPYRNGKCPFCSKKLTNARKGKIEEIIKFDTKTFNVFKKQEDNLQKLNMSIPTWKNKKELKSFNEKLIKYLDIYDSLNEYISFYDRLNNINILEEDIVIKKPPIILNSLLPDFYKPITDFYANMKNIKKSLGELKNKTFEVLNKNTNLINNKLKMLDIPYSIKREKLDENNKTASYFIYHNSDKNKKEMSSFLSDGEKNIIGLLLFLISHKNDELLIIDDPASSFDEYRRKVIFNFIFEFKQQNSTILVLSHDHVFAKFATFYKNDNRYNIKVNIGDIDFIENYDDVKISNIEENDFVTLNELVITRLKELKKQGIIEMNYQVAANLRLFYEPKKTKRKDVYKYLSAIIHEDDYSNIIQLLQDSKYDEEKILRKIKNDTNLSFQYTKLDSNYKNNINIKNFSYLEKLFLLRERVKTIELTKEERKLVKDEASNIIHLNMAYEITLNPYKFNIISKNAYALINKYI